jgi:hypothetical protein
VPLLSWGCEEPPCARLNCTSLPGRYCSLSPIHSCLLRPAIALFYGALCHACSALGVGMMVVMMFFGMSRSLGTVEAPWSWITNAALLAQFPVMHSFFADR